MRKLIITALMAATVLPAVPAMAQSRGEIRRDNRDVREERRDLQDARRYGDRQDIRRERRDLQDARQERREDWRDYRQSNRDVFRQRGAYVGPRGWRYRPVNAGYQLQPSFYGQRYWVNDYARYRLPAYGAGSRYIRYGNDVLLVNVRTGRVIQSYNGFFW